LVACSQSTPTFAVTPQPIETAIPTETLFPTATPTFTLTIVNIPKPTNTPKPISTPIPPSTATLTPIPDSGIIEIPEWAKNFENNIILLTYRNDDGDRPVKVGLINPKTGEQIYIQLQQGFYPYWKDAQHIVFLHAGNCDEPPELMTELDLAQGAITYKEENRKCELFEEEQIAFLELEEPERTVIIVDSITGDEIPLTSPNDGIIDVTFRVSPDENYIAVAQSTGDFEFLEFGPYIGNQISIFRLSDRVLVLKVTEDMDLTSLKFFPNNDKLIYMLDNTPCLIVISSRSKKCIDDIPQKFPDADIYLGDPTSDSNRIGFVYLNDKPHHGGLCFYDLLSGSIDCPTDNFESLNEYGVMNYSLSPDEKYVLFIYDKKGCPLPWCDYASNEHVAVMDIRGISIFELGDSTQILELYNLSWSDFGLSRTWRPLESIE
jgi:hypothetical protein